MPTTKVYVSVADCPRKRSITQYTHTAEIPALASNDLRLWNDWLPTTIRRDLQLTEGDLVTLPSEIKDLVSHISKEFDSLELRAMTGRHEFGLFGHRFKRGAMRVFLLARWSNSSDVKITSGKDVYQILTMKKNYPLAVAGKSTWQIFTLTVISTLFLAIGFFLLLIQTGDGSSLIFGSILILMTVGILSLLLWYTILCRVAQWIRRVRYKIKYPNIAKYI